MVSWSWQFFAMERFFTCKTWLQSKFSSLNGCMRQFYIDNSTKASFLSFVRILLWSVILCKENSSLCCISPAHRTISLSVINVNLFPSETGNCASISPSSEIQRLLHEAAASASRIDYGDQIHHLRSVLVNSQFLYDEILHHPTILNIASTRQARGWKHRWKPSFGLLHRRKVFGIFRLYFRVIRLGRSKQWTACTSLRLIRRVNKNWQLLNETE